jgi:DNA repair protein RecO (recombination protein O)
MAERAIVRTEAVVLRTLDYGETSQIVTLFTRDRGKLAVIAKGARKTKSPYGSTLQPMAYTQVVFYYKPTRTLQTLSESSHVEAFHRIRRSLERITIGLRVVELVDALMEDEDPQPEVFELVRHVLRRLNATERRAANLWPFLQLRLATVLGLGPAVDRERVEAVTEARGWLSLENGGVFPLDAEPREARKASRAALRAYAVFARASLDAVMRMELTPAVRREAESLIEDYLRYHFEESYPDRSREVVAQLTARGQSRGGRAAS